jgi:hypothetical protein
MARFKDFGTPEKGENQEPIKFKLHGEEFVCVPEIQGKVMLDLVADSASQDASKSAAVVTSFFNRVLLPESNERFDALLLSQDKIVSMDTLSEITAWLIEEYTNRPNERPQVS